MISSLEIFSTERYWPRQSLPVYTHWYLIDDISKALSVRILWLMKLIERICISYRKWLADCSHVTASSQSRPVQNLVKMQNVCTCLRNSTLVRARPCWWTDHTKEASSVISALSVNAKICNIRSVRQCIDGHCGDYALVHWRTMWR